MAKSNIILGIDPGTNLLGYAFIQIVNDKKPRIIAMDSLDMRKIKTHAEKLAHIFNELNRLIALYTPNEAAIEAPFYGKDVQAMLKLGRSMGAAMVAISVNNIPLAEYSPRSIKKAVTGNGNASKEQVSRMLPHIVDGEMNTRFADSSDALGVAYCHYLQKNQRGGGSKKYIDWSSYLKDNPDSKANF